MVDGAAERLPADGGVGGIKVRQEIRGIKGGADSGTVVAAGVRSAEVQVGGFAEVAVDAKMADHTDVLAPMGGEDIAGVAAVNLGGALEEPVFRGRQETRKGNAGIVDAVFAADEIVGNEGPVDER